ncbi:N-acetylmuramoyl-L-alanine amidase [Siphonobacter sp. BAB-5385]|uniref:N-acetylmuramoyl-L-alanine amidase family protein n=1 Tax=Siphonobacter sp. BAB-5385 TaxID=1864822 RepID=UPI000B9DD5C4|nr:N-acetylmuramoyl-L-alanine amidase [Siphonobacter sp. BAB-5385]OZI06559.1 N-acetylmuramoyl-L-alanine amidase [Siphonobacter sp. BAB-5385]
MREKSPLKCVNVWPVLGLVLILFSFQENTVSERPPVANPKVDAIRTVVIDAGHGGKDPGAIGKNGTREKNVVLPIALAVGEKIKEHYPNVKVVFTRKTDVFVELHERGAVSNRNKADLFMSIHANALPATRRDFYGTETYVMGLHKSEANLAVAKRENAVIFQEKNYEKKYEGFDPNSPLGQIMLENYQNAYLANSVNFASKVERAFKRADRISRGVKQAGLLVLWTTATPSVLIETGYLSNPTEEAFLASDAGQDKLAEAIFRAFEQYKNEMDN